MPASSDKLEAKRRQAAMFYINKGGKTAAEIVALTNCDAVWVQHRLNDAAGKD